MRSLEPVEESFFSAAPVRVTTHNFVDAKRSAVFAAISGDPAAWGDWFPGFSHKGRWETPPPYGVGSVRSVDAYRTQYRETVLAWDTDERWAFRVDAMSSAMFDAFAEDYRLHDAGPGTLLIWTAAFRPGRALRLAAPLAPATFQHMARRIAKRLGQLRQHHAGVSRRGVRAKNFEKSTLSGSKTVRNAKLSATTVAARIGPTGHLKHALPGAEIGHMAPVPGWYSDPIEPAQLRYWDGQVWTTATSATPPARQYAAVSPQPAMATAASMSGQPFRAAGQWEGAPSPQYGAPDWYAARPGSAAGSHRPSSSRGPKRWKIAVTAVAALAVAAGIAVPIVVSSSKPSLSKAFTSSLLTPETVSATAGGTFTIDNSTDDNSSDDSTSGCLAASNLLDGNEHDKADGSRSFVSPSQGMFIDEELSNNPTNGQQLDELRTALQSCHTMTSDGDTMHIALAAPPLITGSYDALDIEMSGQISGRTVFVDESVARFGNNIIAIMVMGSNGSDQARAIADSLLGQAITAARPALHRNS